MEGMEGFAAGGLSFLGGAMTNASNAKTAHKQMEFQMNMARDQRGFEAEEARINRAFQAGMSDTAHRREMADLQAAGLNPILTATGGPGAATPSGAQGRSSGASGAGFQAVDAIGNAVSSALAARRNKAEIANMEANTRERDAHRGLLNLQSNTETVEYQRRLAEKDASRSEADILSEQLKGWRTEGKIDESSYGQFLRYGDRLGKSIGSAVGARRLFQQK